MVRYAGLILITFGGLTGTYLFTVAKGVLATPGNLKDVKAKMGVLSDKVDTLTARFGLNDSLHRGQALANTFRCFDVRDSLFRGMLTACGEAFTASRVDPSVWRRPRP